MTDISDRHLDAECITNARLDNFYKYLSLTSDTSRSKRIALVSAVDLLNNITFSPDKFSLRLNGIGEWVGSVDSTEYMMMSWKEFNGGTISINMREVVGYICLSQDHIKFETLDTLELPDRSSYIKSNINATVKYAKDTDLLNAVIADPWEEFQTEINDYTFDPLLLCDTAVLRCPGELYPYKSVQECYDNMSTTPQACLPEQSGGLQGGMNGYFQGDTVACRYLHLSSAALRPMVHCAHMSSTSVKCSSEMCPSAVRMNEIHSLLPVFDGYIPVWMLWIEVCLVAFFILFPFATYAWYIRERRISDIPVRLTNLNELPDKSKVLPKIVMSDVRLSWTKKHGGEDIFSFAKVSLGGKPITALTAPSGTGKSSFMKLLSGFRLDYMKLSVGKFSTKPNMLMCDQSPAMWPKEMCVKDILIFSCTLLGSKLAHFSDIFGIIEIDSLFDQQFGTLSGGQQQLVHIASSIVSPHPTLVLLDEPLSSLDEAKSINLLRQLKKLSRRCGHSFIMTVHMCSDTITNMFDDIVVLAGNGGFQDLRDKNNKDHEDAGSNKRRYPILEMAHEDGIRRVIESEGESEKSSLTFDDKDQCSTPIWKPYQEDAGSRMQYSIPQMVHEGEIQRAIESESACESESESDRVPRSPLTFDDKVCEKVYHIGTGAKACK